MAIVDVGHVAAIYRRTQRPSQLAWSEGRRPPGALTYIRQDEPGELSQWIIGQDDSTINIVFDYYYYYFMTLKISRCQVSSQPNPTIYSEKGTAAQVPKEDQSMPKN